MLGSGIQWGVRGPRCPNGAVPLWFVVRAQAASLGGGAVQRGRPGAVFGCAGDEAVVCDRQCRAGRANRSGGCQAARATCLGNGPVACGRLRRVGSFGPTGVSVVDCAVGAGEGTGVGAEAAMAASSSSPSTSQ